MALDTYGGVHTSCGPPGSRSRAEMQAMLERALRGRRSTPLSEGRLRAALRRAGVAHPFREGPLWLHEFCLTAEPDMVPLARRRVAEFSRDCGLAGDPFFDMVLAVGEALANAVEHGSPRGTTDRVHVRVGILEHAVAVEVHDSGVGFLDCPVALQDSLETGGRGIPFMRLLVDEVTFDCSGRGTIVLLVKHAA